MKIRDASFSLRVVRRRDGTAAIIHRRRVDDQGRERLIKIASISPLGYSAGAPLLRSAARGINGYGTKLEPGPFIPLDGDWGARVACYALVVKGLRNTNRMRKAAANLRHADPTEAAWWLGLMTGSGKRRAVRALRILMEAVK